MSNHTSAGAASSAKGSPAAWAWSLIGIAVIGTIAYFARMGAVSPRIANPEVTGVPRPVEFLFGFDKWVEVHEFFTVVVMVALLVICITAWRRNPGHPYVLMAIASTAIVWQDPIMNWAPYAVYNPQLWHWPEDWPLINLSPTVEPFIVVGYALFYFGPFFPAMALLRRLQAGKPREAFVCRHPLWTLAGLILVIGFLIDMVLEVSLVRTGLYIYSQTLPWGTLFAGTTFQFPLLVESTLVCLVM
ncbi:MAG TPA: spirocyclase AveC family protein, partial [Nevskiaceae bacterium]|nr:spirocyclase AveC family protein [Nevskiaceae bacterium]